MCYGCWEEEGKPSIVNEKTKAAAQAVHDLYEISCVGGAMHIVTDDWNLEDSHIAYCGEEIERGEHWSFETEGARDAARKVCDLFKTMTIEERASALALERGFIGEDGTEPPKKPIRPVPFNVMSDLARRFPFAW